MAKWKDGHNCELLINKMEKTRHVNDDGSVVFKGNNIILIPPQIEAVVELNSDISQDEKSGIIWQGIRNAGRLGSLTSKSVLAEIRKLEGLALSKKESKYVLVSKVSVNPLKHKLSRIQINNCSISFSKNLAKKYTDSIDKGGFAGLHFHEYSEMTRDYTYLKTTTHAKGMYSAAEKSLIVLKYYCGLFNYAINYGSRLYSIGDNRFRPINKIKLGPIHTLHSPNGELIDRHICWLEDEYFEAPESYFNNRVGDFDRITNNFSNYHCWIKKGIIKSQLEDAISLYYDAFHSYSYDTAYVRLWAILELLTDTGRSNYDVTVRRVAFIFEDPLEAKNHLYILRDNRNSIVHKGAMYGRKDIFIYDLKMYVERLIRFMMWAGHNFESLEEIKQFLDCTPDETQIDKKIIMLKKARGLERFKAY